ncbi:hypothetical protein D1816_16965 [Aquimarina sp. AD10]|uniref:Uncharacterized protein n=1 Tax=Aquimarina aggregata TaxID=1642818 RepID=A0A162Z9T4_9FLAO|nr:MULTISPECIES: hypothetical protein [Aquimarina]AXT61975.1 hypothetical protein D1816_16965 [Aquimarina sp. AD10]KZS39650.1 hypothetical protein AWE51_08340 [Aquimarina aggregata]RKN02434.1 hypothetical protein D7033_01080 [Aquimarina sp. AD10]
MKSSRHIIASIFLMIFSFIQLADLHVLDHDANDVDCTICQFASQDHNDDFISAEIVMLPDAVIIPADVVRSTYENRYFKTNKNHSFLNKAPPVA